MQFRVGSYGAPPANQTQLDILAGALEVDGALSALIKVEIYFRSTSRVMAKLAEALVGAPASPRASYNLSKQLDRQRPGPCRKHGEAARANSRVPCPDIFLCAREESLAWA